MSAAAPAPRTAASPDAVEPAPVFAAAAPSPARRSRLAPPRPAEPNALRGDGESEPGELVGFGPNTSLVLRRIGTPGVTGGLLQANPHLEKRHRRQLGLAVRF